MSADDFDFETYPEPELPNTIPDTNTDANKGDIEGHIACAFSFLCPQRYSKLEPVPVIEGYHPSIRHCTECDRDVHLVWSQAMYDKSAKQGHCVAVLTKHPRDLDPDLDLIRKAENTGRMLLGAVRPPEPEPDYEAETGHLDIVNMD